MNKTRTNENSNQGLTAIDLRRFIGWRSLLPGLIAAIVSGLLLSACFSPLEWGWAAWFALIPLLAVPIPRRLSQRLLIGYLFGFTHFATSLSWLNEVGFMAGYLLALYCALYLMAWYLLVSAWLMQLTRAINLTSSNSDFHRLSLWSLGAFPLMLTGLWCATSWVSMEWLRSWLFTGFPWNHLGLSQWQNPFLLQLVGLTGIYGLSFILVITNLAWLWIIISIWRHWHHRSRIEFPWPVLTALFLLLLVRPLTGTRQQRLESPPDTTLRIAAIQGNLPQARVWTPGQLETALEVYDRLTREAAKEQPDLIVWPETAVPAPAFHNQQYLQMLEQLINEIRIPLLFGNIHMEPIIGTEPIVYNDFNSAFLLDENGRINDYYHKIRLVPFGEYVPMGRLLPFLHDLIGMGRDLTAGREFTLFKLTEEVWTGTNICFEDVFPQVSRNFVKRGATLLMTLTNDAWFVESAGSRQHMIHAVLRAVENRRPLLRSGNSSDTCLILPSGEVRELLYDHETGNRFIRDWHIYSVPVWFNPGTTFYTRHGDLFAHACAGLTLVWLIMVNASTIRKRKQRLQTISGTVDSDDAV